MVASSNLFELKVDTRLENLSVIADFITKTAKKLGVEKDIHKVQVAIEEACVNIIKYAYGGEGGIIAISSELQNDDLVITITDKGKPFDHTSIPLPDLESDIHKREIGGLGIHVMRKLMDNVKYSYDTEKGNQLIMRKKVK